MFSISKLYNIITGRGKTPPAANIIQRMLEECAHAKGGEVSARARATSLADLYLKLDREGRRVFLIALSLEFAPDHNLLTAAFDKYNRAADIQSRCYAETTLRMAMYSPRKRILTMFNAIPMGVKFLVDLRAELLGFIKETPELKVLDSELKECLTAWFDVGFLDLIRLTWNSPAILLEKLTKYEAVHKINSWQDLKNRLDDSDRRCYAFFHPKMPVEPLIFVQAALTDKLEGNVQELLDENAPPHDASQATTAIFYSISNCQDGLRGITFGNFLLKRVIESMSRDFPKLKTFATLSPIPGLANWMENNPRELADACYPADRERLAELGITGSRDPVFKNIVKNPQEYMNNAALTAALKEPLMRTAAKYLVVAKTDGRPADYVARFHLGNGAQVERLNWMADSSKKGFSQSLGIMVNYLYDPDKLEENVEKFTGEGKISISPIIKKMTERASHSDIAKTLKKRRGKK